VTAIRKWNTPNVADAKGGTRRGNGQVQLCHQVRVGGTATPPMKTPPLNPSWVEWLMGWPIAWTDLRPLGMDGFRQWASLHGVNSSGE